MDSMENSRKRTEPMICLPMFISKQKQEKFERSKIELPSLKAKYAKAIKLWIIIGTKTENYTMFTLVHRDKMNMFSQKLKTRNIRTEAIDSLKLERINYLQEQIETVKKHIEELVTVAQSILSPIYLKSAFVFRL